MLIARLQDMGDVANQPTCCTFEVKSMPRLLQQPLPATQWAATVALTPKKLSEKLFDQASTGSKTGMER
ncbi:MAG: hypothetical protein MI924_06935, partial [Chloroflexales bacterium]|nr:hypothetical protein [Chloroflexales bacterium]